MLKINNSVLRKSAFVQIKHGDMKGSCTHISGVALSRQNLKQIENI